MEESTSALDGIASQAKVHTTSEECVQSFENCLNDAQVNLISLHLCNT